MSRFAIAQSRLPSKFPGPDTAVMVISIGLISTTRPNKSRWIAPVCRVRMVHVAGSAAVIGTVTGTFVAVARTVPVALVSVPLTVPTAFSVRFRS